MLREVLFLLVESCELQITVLTSYRSKLSARV